MSMQLRRTLMRENGDGSRQSAICNLQLAIRPSGIFVSAHTHSIYLCDMTLARALSYT